MNFQFYFERPYHPQTLISETANESTNKSSTSFTNGLQLKRQYTTNITSIKPLSKRVKIGDGKIVKSEPELSQFDTSCSPISNSKESALTISPWKSIQCSQFEHSTYMTNRILVRDKSQSNIANIKHQRCASFLTEASPLFYKRVDDIEAPDPPKVTQFKALPLNKRILERPDKLPQVHKRISTITEEFGLSKGAIRVPFESYINQEPKKMIKKTSNEIKPFVLQTELRAKNKIIPMEFIEEIQKVEFKARPLPNFYQNREKKFGNFSNKSVPPCNIYYMHSPKERKRNKTRCESTWNEFT